MNKDTHYLLMLSHQLYCLYFHVRPIIKWPFRIEILVLVYPFATVPEIISCFPENRDSISKSTLQQCFTPPPTQSPVSAPQTHLLADRAFSDDPRALAGKDCHCKHRPLPTTSSWRVRPGPLDVLGTTRPYSLDSQTFHGFQPSEQILIQVLLPLVHETPAISEEVD